MIDMKLVDVIKNFFTDRVFFDAWFHIRLGKADTDAATCIGSRRIPTVFMDDNVEKVEFTRDEVTIWLTDYSPDEKEMN